MDPVSAIGAFAALVSASNSGLILLQNLIKSTNTVERLQREFVVLRHVFHECGETVLGSIPEEVPQSIKEISHMSMEKYHELLKILEKFVNKPKMARMVLYAYHEHELMLCYNGFRDSVMLLRDLCSEMKMSQHLMQNSEEMSRHFMQNSIEMSRHFMEMSIAMARMMAEEEDDDEQDYRNLAEGVPVEPHRDQAQDGSQEHDGATNASPRKAGRRSAGLRFQALLKDFASLLSMDFTRSLILVLETAGPQDQSRFQYVPVRNKIDTGSDENFISKQLIDKHHMDPSIISEIPVDKLSQRTLAMLNGLTFTPTQEVKIRWHKPQDKKQREDTFIIVESDLFDVLIGSKQWTEETQESVFFSFRRHKPEPERKKEEEEEQAAKKDQRKVLEKQIAETEELLGETKAYSSSKKGHHVKSFSK